MRGPHASERIETLERRLVEAFGRNHVAKEVRRASSASGLRSEALDIAMIVLAIPPAALATLELAKRAELMALLRPIIKDVQDAYDAITEADDIYIKPPGGTLQNPKQVTPEAILDAAQRASEGQRD